MLTEQIAPEKDVQTTEVDEARHFLETDFKTSYVATTLDRLNIGTDGQVEVDGQRFPFTQSFLEAAAGEIGMPLRYAYDIDLELFQYNFDQQKRKHSKAIVLCINRGAAVNFTTKVNYRPAQTQDILDGLQIGGSLGFQQILLSDQGAEINFLYPGLKADPEPGDIVELGIRVSNSETGYPGLLKAALFASRLVCSNGAVMADRFGTVRWNYDRRVHYATSVQKFLRDVEELRDKAEELVTLYKGVTEHPLLDHHFTKLWRRVRRDLEPAQVDQALGVDLEERRAIQATVRERLSTEPPQPTAWTLWQVHNNITAAAQDYGFRVRRGLEQIGGGLLSSISLN